jgi:hypothetical protein
MPYIEYLSDKPYALLNDPLELEHLQHPIPLEVFMKRKRPVVPWLAISDMDSYGNSIRIAIQYTAIGS